MDFRFRADGSAIEPVSGSNKTFFQAFDDFGHRWLITTSHHAQYALPLPHRYLICNPHVAIPRSMLGASDYHNTFPNSQLHRWRRKRGAYRRWVKSSTVPPSFLASFMKIISFVAPTESGASQLDST